MQTKEKGKSYARKGRMGNLLDSRCVTKLVAICCHRAAQVIYWNVGGDVLRGVDLTILV
jgi:hypothetical protein